MRREFGRWLEAQGYGTGTVASQIHRVGRVEESYGDIEEHFRRDRLQSVISALRYTTEDERADRPNPSKIPFLGKPRTNLASYRNAVENCVRFLSGEGVTPAISIDGDTSRPPARREATQAALRMDDPVAIRMHEIVNSPEGREACLSATERGLPAMAGVDPLLRGALGAAYGGANFGTATAGFFVADLMRSLAYVKEGQRALPPGCVARSGIVWVPANDRKEGMSPVGTAGAPPALRPEPESISIEGSRREGRRYASMPNTLFNKVDYTLGSLIEAIGAGQLALPDIQRPFVWKNVKVRELFDSMYRGYPVGYLLFWETGVQAGARQIGVEQKQLAPTRVIVDGQQRLTSLYAVIKGRNVVRENYAIERIEIAFNPMDSRFAVADAAIRQNRAFIPNISSIWNPETNLIQFCGDYLEKLREIRDLSRDEISDTQQALGRLHALLHYPFTALELSSAVEAEDVADIFVRINSEGKKLNQSDFILTLMSVFWDEGRTQLEVFSRSSRTPNAGVPSPFNHLFQPFPDQLLRVTIAVGFRRARLSAVYAILRGRAADGGQTNLPREKHFESLKQGQAETLKLEHWHDFMNCVMLAGFRSPSIISSQNVLIYSYALYLIGRVDVGVDVHRLQQAVAQWLFMASLTGRYTSSPESQMEFDLARLREVKSAEDFLSVLAAVCTATLTGDFWATTLPGDLATSAARSPSMFAFFAALNVLDARALYSRHTVRELMDPARRGARSSLERHHLFPVGYLKDQGIDGEREYNQIANFAILEWGDNASISDRPPSQYVPVLEQRFDPATLRLMHEHHALPAGWETMQYETFLRERRSLMARTIRSAFEKLAAVQARKAVPVSITEIIKGGEAGGVEFKSTLRTNTHTGEFDGRIELAVLKSIASFLNGKGGTLIIGVKDNGSAVGFEPDRFASEDKMSLHLINLLKERVGAAQIMNVEPMFDEHEGVRVLVVVCAPSNVPVFVKDGSTHRFFVRFGPSTQELSGADQQEYIKQRF